MSVTSEQELEDWFGYLQSFKTCAEKIDTDVVALSLLDFANAKTTKYLPDALDQNTFAVCAENATGIPMDSADVSSASSFVALLKTTFGEVNEYVGAYLRDLALASVQGDTTDDFMAQRNSVVFPLGASDPIWTKMNAGLAGIIDASCYSTTQQKAVGGIVSNAGKQVSDVVNQIAKLG